MLGGAGAGHGHGRQLRIDGNAGGAVEVGVAGKVDTGATDMAGDEAAGVEAGRRLDLIHARLGQLHFAPCYLPLGLGNLAQLEGLGHARLALDELGDHWPRGFGLGLLEGIDADQQQVQPDGTDDGNQKGPTQAADDLVEINARIGFPRRNLQSRQRSNLWRETTTLDHNADRNCP